MHPDKSCGGCTPEQWRALLQYNPETGLFRWRNPAWRQPKGWIAGHQFLRGYRRIFFEGRHYMSHRVAYAIMTGEWPPTEVDHRNGIPHDNRWENLRAATHAQNCMNRRTSVNSSTGVNGVTLFVARGHIRYRASISVGGKRKSLGLYDTVAQAAVARRQAAGDLYGEFARAP